MVQSNNILSITSSTVLSKIYDNTLINATGGNITITLPLITANGRSYRFIRDDITSNTVTLQGATGNNFIQNLGTGGTTSTLNILPQTNAQIQAFNDNWYVTLNSTTIRSGAKALFSSAFIQNNGNPFVTFAGGNGNPLRIVCSFSYPGYSTEYITNASVVVGGATGVTGNFYITPNGGTAGNAIVAQSITLPGPPTVVTSTSVNTSFLPFSMAVLDFYIQVFGGSNSTINLYSLVIS